MIGGRRSFVVTLGWLLTTACWLLVCAGCPTKPTAPVGPVRLPLQGVTLKLIVVDDPAIAQSLSQLKSEWNALSGGELDIIEMSTAESIATEALDCDAAIYPSALIGTFAERRQLAMIPQSTLDSTDLVWHEVFDALPQYECSWGGETLALSLGSPVFTLMYREDLLKQAGKKPPKTWSDYQKLVEQLQSTGDDSNSSEIVAAIEPLAPGWAGRVLLARAAGYVRHRDNFSSLFRIDNLEPLIAGPPFVKALEELIAASKTARSESKSMTPTETRREVLAGRAVMALTWASHADSQHEKQELPDGATIGFAEIPGSNLAYNISTKAWEKRDATEANEVPLLSIAGRLASVTRSTDYPEGAMRLIAWLSGPKWSTPVSSASEATTIFRTSQLKTAEDWVDANLDRNSAVNYGETVQQSLVRTTCLTAPRIPSEAEYMTALDEAVLAALAGTAKPDKALKAAAAKWSEITERLGLDKQRAAYQHSLGLTP